MTAGQRERSLMQRLTGLWLRLFLWLALGLITPAAWATLNDLVVERAWFEDPSGQLGWQDATQQPTRPVANVLSAGYGTASVWLKVRIDPGAAGIAADSRLVVRVRPAYLDEVILHDPLQTPARHPPVGDHYPVSQQTEPGTAFLYHIAAGTAPRDLWLRVQTSSARLVYAEVMSPQTYRLSATQIEHLGAIYLGLIAVFFLWGVIHVLVRPERLMLSFLFYQASAFLVGACLWGYGNLYLSDLLGAKTVDLLTNLLIVLGSGAAILFSHFVLNEMGPVRWRTRILLGILLVYPVLLLGVWGGHTSQALKVNMLLILLVPLLIWLLALFSPTRIPNERRSHHRGLPKWIVMGYFSLTLIFTFLTAAPALGLIKGAEISIYIVFLYSISTGILMVLMLQYRAWIRVREQSELQAMAEEAATRAIVEKSNREDRERLLAMLGHELKTPLATLRMLVANRDIPAKLSRQLDSSVSDMALVVERAMQSEQIHAGAVPLNLQNCDLVALLKTVQDELPGNKRMTLLVPDSDTCVVQTDPALMKVVLRNLLDNALKYSPPDAEVTVWLSSVDGRRHKELTVSNPPGRAGMPDAERVFSKFYRSPKAGHLSGSGLGLFLAQGLTRRLGAELTYEPEDDLIRFRLKI